jgi:predicted nuclease of predicted toxin-antitoxin system
MRFLADESCDFAVVRALRADGRDVLAVSEFRQRSIDEEVLQLAISQKRILLTEDKDFGRIVFASPVSCAGVILIRYPASARKSLPGAVLRLIREYPDQIERPFTVLRPGAARILPTTRTPQG